MNVKEKLDAIEASDLMVAYDGCHKLYLCKGDADQAVAIETGYTLYPAAQIRELVNGSCGLVFVNNLALNGGSWTGPMTIDQFKFPESWYAEPKVDV